MPAPTLEDITLPRSHWNARDPRSTSTRDINNIDSIFLHHTTGEHLGRTNTASWVRSIQDFHMDSQGWNDIGYTYVVDKKGNIFEGRDISHIPAHAAGHNTNSIGVAFLGDGSTDTIPTPALYAIKRLVLALEAKLNKSLTRRSHRDVGNTTCPGNFLHNWWQSIDPSKALEDDTKEYSMILFGERGTPDYDVAAALVQGTFGIGVATPWTEEAQEAADRGETVVAVGGPAADAISGDTVVKVVGEDAADTARLLAEKMMDMR